MLFQKYPVAEDWPYEQARKLFQEPEVTPAADVPVNFLKYFFLEGGGVWGASMGPMGRGLAV